MARRPVTPSTPADPRPAAAPRAGAELAPPAVCAAPRPLRADARRNFDLLVAAADAVFTEHGADASFEDIARRAGVGIGTLYRHFPTRDALLAAVLDGRTAAIAARAHELLAAPSPSEALVRWLEALVRYVTMFRGLAEAITAAYAGKDDPLCRSCDTITAAGEALVARAQAAGEVRRDADPHDLILAAHAAAWVGETVQDPEAPGRLLAMVLAGLRDDGGAATPARGPAATPARRPAATPARSPAAPRGGRAPGAPRSRR